MQRGNVGIVGRTNVGKSTFLNAVLGEPLAIVSPLPQTTRDALLGVVHRPNAQIALHDTPGLHRPKSELGRRMNLHALDVARVANALLFVTDVSAARTPGGLGSEDTRLLGETAPESPCVVAVNKIDLLKDKALLLPTMEAIAKLRQVAAIVPMSALRTDGTETVLDELTKLLPEGPAYEEDLLTNQPNVFFVREYVREQIMLLTRAEVPHAIAVTVERYEEREGLVITTATIHVEKEGQKGVLVGRGGSMIKQIGTAARLRLEALVGCRVHLELFVRKSPRWKDVPRRLVELGYDEPTGTRPGPTRKRRK